MRPEGLSSDDLLAIGTRRKSAAPSNMSATDINQAIPHVIAQNMIAGMAGYEEDILKGIAEHKIALPSAAPEKPNDAIIAQLESILTPIQAFLGIRTR